MFCIKKPLPSKEKLNITYKERKNDLEETIKALSGIIQETLSENKINYTIKYRVKKFQSLYEKILRNAAKNETGIIKITDILGLRIICPFLQDIDEVSKILQTIFIVEEVDVKGSDYPFHRFGYESVHFLIRIPDKCIKGNLSKIKNSNICEVQVRTILQEAWAEVEHEIIYKSDFSPLDEPLKRKLAALNANLTLSDITFQEIRDYQKEFHKALKQRRKKFHEKILQDNNSSKDVDNKDLETYETYETVDILLLKGLTAHNKEKYNDAINIYSEILKRDIRNDIKTIIHVHRGMAYYSNGQIENAMKDFNEALQLDPDNSSARYYRALHSRINKKYDEALNDLEKCIEKEPFNLDYITARAETYSEEGNLEKAVFDLKYVLSLDEGYKPAAELLKKISNEL